MFKNRNFVTHRLSCYFNLQMKNKKKKRCLICLILRSKWATFQDILRFSLWTISWLNFLLHTCLHTFVCHLPTLSGRLICVSYYQHILILPPWNNNMADTQTAQLHLFIHLEKWHGGKNQLILQENFSLCHHLVVLTMHIYKMRAISYF